MKNGGQQKCLDKALSLKRSLSGNQWKRCHRIFLDIEGRYCSGNKLKYGGWYSFLSYVKNKDIFADFIIELAALAVKSGWVSSDKNIFMSIFTDGLGFGAALWANLEQGIIFVKVVSYLNYGINGI